MDCRRLSIYLVGVWREHCRCNDTYTTVLSLNQPSAPPATRLSPVRLTQAEDDGEGVIIRTRVGVHTVPYSTCRRREASGPAPPLGGVRGRKRALADRYCIRVSGYACWKPLARSVRGRARVRMHIAFFTSREPAQLQPGHSQVLAHVLENKN
eukprot:COSAG02_NODE_7833_length_2830_cov_19.067941_3_plen_153_part_00